MTEKIKVTLEQKNIVTHQVKQLIALNLKQPTKNTSQEDINRLIKTISARFHDMFEIIN